MKILRVKNKDIILDDEDYDLIKDKTIFFKNTGHAIIYLGKGKRQYLHRYLLKYDGKLDVDHINRNVLDNRKENLRLVTKQQNQMNRKVKGVTYDKRRGKFVAQIMINRKQHYLGSADTFEEAKKIRIEGEKKYFGEYAPIREVMYNV